MKCSKCSETDHASDAIFCHMCGERLQKTNTLAIVLPILGVLAFVLILIWIFSNSSSQSRVSSEPEYIVPTEPNRTGNNSVTVNYSNEGSSINQSSLTKITINGEDISDTYSSGGNSVVIIDNNQYFSNNNSVNHVYAITNQYTQLIIENAFEVNVSDTARRITISSNENAIPEVIEAEGGNKLIIRNKSTRINGLSQVTIPYNPNITNIKISGASKFNSNHALKGQNTQIDLSGSSNLNCNIESKELSLHMEGSSDANLSGRAGTIKLNLGGSSSLVSRMVGNSYALACDNCNGSMSGSSEAYIHCERNISINLSGASDLHYSGNASTSGSSFSGASSIIHY